MANNLDVAEYLPIFATLGIHIYSGSGAPTFTAAVGSLYINTSATTSTTRLYINTDGGTTWAYFTASA